MTGPESGQSDDAEKDIVDHLSEATGYFHDDDAARLRDIAEASGQKPVGIVKAAVEREIERREWKCVHFEHDESDEYPSSNPYEYYRIHKKLQKEYEAAIDELPKQDDPVYDRVKEEFERAKKTLEEEARVHEAKADVAEQWLRENDEDPQEVLLA
jgi:hypothetical protein